MVEFIIYRVVGMHGGWRKMNWETFSTKLIPYTLIIFAVTFIGGFVFGFLYRYYTDRKRGDC